MNENVRRTVLLHLNTEDVEKKMKNLTTRLYSCYSCYVSSISSIADFVI